MSRALVDLALGRGARVDRTCQLKCGGRTDFQTMLERERLETKTISKARAVTSPFDVPIAPLRPHEAEPGDRAVRLIGRWLAEKSYRSV